MTLLESLRDIGAEAEIIFGEPDMSDAEIIIWIGDHTLDITDSVIKQFGQFAVDDMLEDLINETKNYWSNPDRIYERARDEKLLGE